MPVQDHRVHLAHTLLTFCFHARPPLRNLERDLVAGGEGFVVDF